MIESYQEEKKVFQFGSGFSIRRNNNSTCTVEEISESPYFESLSDDDLIDFLASQQDENTIDEYDQYLLDNDIDISQLEKSLWKNTQ